MGALDPRWFLFSLLGILTSGLQSLLKWLTDKLLTQLFSTIEIANDSPVFDYTLQWIQSHPNATHFKSLSLERVDYQGLPNIRNTMFDLHPSDEYILRRGTQKPSPVLGISSGTHFLWHKRKPLWIHKSKVEGQFPANTIPREVLTLKTLGRNPAYVRELLQEIIESAYEASKQTVEIRASSMSNWGYPCTKKPRPLESVVLPEGVLENLLADCEWFLDSEDWYHSLSIPYRRGYLLYGEPGTGKSVTIHSIATKLKAGIWCVNIGDPGLSDVYLLNLLQTVPSGDIILFEDIDRIRIANKEEGFEGPGFPMGWTENKGVTLSGLLNALDGLSSQTGRLVFMTTNHKDKLDPALIRPGRIDYQQKFGYANEYQAAKLFERFFPGTTREAVTEFAGIVAQGNFSMAELQQILLVHRESSELAILETRNVVIHTQDPTLDFESEPHSYVGNPPEGSPDE